MPNHVIDAIMKSCGFVHVPQGYYACYRALFPHDPFRDGVPKCRLYKRCEDKLNKPFNERVLFVSLAKMGFDENAEIEYVTAVTCVTERVRIAEPWEYENNDEPGVKKHFTTWVAFTTHTNEWEAGDEEYVLAR